MPYWTETQKGGKTKVDNTIYERVSSKEFKKAKENAEKIQERLYDKITPIDGKNGFNNIYTYFIRFQTKGMIQKQGEKGFDYYKVNECVKIRDLRASLLPYPGKDLELEVIVEGDEDE